MTLDGTWFGFYEYGASYGLPFFAQRVPVRITFTTSAEGIAGVCQEEATDLSVAREANLRGFLEGQVVSLVKTYAEVGAVPDANAALLGEVEETEVEYNGFLDAERNSLYGEWVIYALNETGPDGLPLVEGHGLWLLTREA
ncbi:hypothetical protein SAMN05421823_103133 [Catalinimonas alkaloidigena]|uniref:Lipocalin-like domain-containing protein n=1 Tax=Catalinimonas alkaloidigena TaxID=1075417 RepID=A0A1G9DHH1_9BACT|nr:hypothetical protein [Catalinimonas alkaloidigena]SDK63270.1 hypothetical protein SAMN05421823_103133 [Catalinimonas alkaloidigena]